MASLDVRVENAVGLFIGGMAVRGRIHVYFPSKQRIRGVRVRLIGEANTRVPHSSMDRHLQSFGAATGEKWSDIRENDTFLRPEVILFNAEDKEVGPGEMEFEFSFVLPPNAPPSVAGFDHFHINYSLHAIMDIPWAHDVVSSIPINVHPAVDLPRLLSTPVRGEKSKTFFGGGSHPASFQATIPKTVWVPGESVPITIQIQNPTKKRIRGVRVLLHSTFLIRAGGQFLRIKKKYGMRIVTDISVEPNATMAPMTFSYPIPDTSPPFSVKTNLVDVSYAIKLSLEVSYAKNLAGYLPIVLTTRESFSLSNAVYSGGKVEGMPGLPISTMSPIQPPTAPQSTVLFAPAEGPSYQQLPLPPPPSGETREENAEKTSTCVPLVPPPIPSRHPSAQPPDAMPAPIMSTTASKGEEDVGLSDHTDDDEAGEEERTGDVESGPMEGQRTALTESPRAVPPPSVAAVPVAYPIDPTAPPPHYGPHPGSAPHASPYASPYPQPHHQPGLVSVPAPTAQPGYAPTPSAPHVTPSPASGPSPYMAQPAYPQHSQ
eukprot:TRINITY_DN257_c0_g1_i14.p1 TRINITY_DN257_c0_g1~~TRINITY_DN257_c0_g1_i14.p1  ORF type:complete len:544 (-),score=124.33 TRINITY_DN257_c0_g1_i14:2822-4453(-)